MTSKTFRRYTNLASTLHILRNRKLTLLSPETWDDKNDAYFMAEYKRLREFQSVLAICFAVSSETYHHWRVFSRGVDGVCIEFDEVRLLEVLNCDEDIKHGYVDYHLLKSVQNMDQVDLNKLPFMKRWPYGDEKEYRAVYASKKSLAFRDVPINLDSIKRITLSPWLPLSLVPTIKDVLIAQASGIKISRSTLIDNSRWKKLTSRVAGPATSL